MGFTQFKTRPPKSITLSKSNIHFPRDARALFGDILDDRLDLYLDKDNKALKLVKNPEGTNKIIKAKGNYWRISTKISNELPCGIYVYKEDGIFEYYMPSLRAGGKP